MINNRIDARKTGVNLLILSAHCSVFLLSDIARLFTFPCRKVGEN